MSRLHRAHLMGASNIELKGNFWQKEFPEKAPFNENDLEVRETNKEIKNNDFCFAYIYHCSEIVVVSLDYN